MNDIKYVTFICLSSFLGACATSNNPLFAVQTHVARHNMGRSPASDHDGAATNSSGNNEAGGEAALPLFTNSTYTYHRFGPGIDPEVNGNYSYGTGIMVGDGTDKYKQDPDFAKELWDGKHEKYKCLNDCRDVVEKLVKHPTQKMLDLRKDIDDLGSKVIAAMKKLPAKDDRVIGFVRDNPLPKQWDITVGYYDDPGHEHIKLNAGPRWPETSDPTTGVSSWSSIDEGTVDVKIGDKKKCPIDAGVMENLLDNAKTKLQEDLKALQ